MVRKINITSASSISSPKPNCNKRQKMVKKDGEEGVNVSENLTALSGLIIDENDTQQIARVAEVKDQIKNGTYRINFDALAKKIASLFFKKE